jgi:Tol biopolymer transport system component
MRRLSKLPLIVLVVIIAMIGQTFVWAGTLQTELNKISRTKQWIISSNSPVKGITAKVGDKEHVIYEPPQSNVGFGHRAVSPRGRKLAFVKTVGDGIENPVRLKLGTVDIDGSNYSEFLDVVKIAASDIALSYDERKLAFMGAVRKDSYSLVVLDVSSRPARIITERPLPSGKSFINMTSQAWAPDNERLVYVDGKGHIVILNVAANTEEDLGPGDVPTWSRDGRFIAYRADIPGNPPGDYFLVSVVSPREPNLLLSNRSLMAGTQKSNWYVGPALWSPDNRFLLIMRIVGVREYQQPYALEVKTGKTEALPMGSMGDMRSWGGQP